MFKLFKKHICNFSIKLYNIPRNEHTAILITQCKCGKTHLNTANYKSPMYKDFIHLVE